MPEKAGGQGGFEKERERILHSSFCCLLACLLARTVTDKPSSALGSRRVRTVVVGGVRCISPLTDFDSACQHQFDLNACIYTLWLGYSTVYIDLSSDHVFVQACCDEIIDGCMYLSVIRGYRVASSIYLLTFFDLGNQRVLGSMARIRIRKEIKKEKAHMSTSLH